MKVCITSEEIDELIQLLLIEGINSKKLVRDKLKSLKECPYEKDLARSVQENRD